MRPSFFANPEVVLALAPARARQLVERVGGAPPAGATSLALARYVASRDAPDAVQSAIEAVARFAFHPDGRAALLEAASAVDRAPAEVALDLPAGDLAAALLASSDPNARRVLDRARVRVERSLAPRPSYELAGAVDPTKLTERLDRALDDAHQATWGPAIDDEGRAHWFVLYAASPIATARADLASDTAEVSVVHPTRVDVLRVDARASRVRLTTASPHHFARYAEALVLSLRPSLSLKRLLDLGAAGFSALPLPSGLRAWSIVGLRWDSGDDARFESRGASALAALEAHAHVAGGYFSRATLRLVPAEVSAPAFDVFVQLPHRLDLAEPAHEALARRALDALGVLVPGAIPDDAHALAPFVHPEWRYREALGDDAFTRAVDRRALVCVGARGAASPEARALGRSLKLHPLANEPGVSYATPEDMSLPAHDVGEAREALYELDRAALVAAMRADLGLREPDEEPWSLPGVLDLGALDVAGRGRVRVAYLSSRPKRGLVRALRSAARVGDTPVLLVPRGRRLADEGVHQVELDLEEQLGATSLRRVLAHLAAELRIEDAIEPWRLAPPDRPLVIDLAAERAWLEGVELTKLSDQAHRLLAKLALADGVVPVKELGAHVSPGADYPDVVIRKVRARLREQIVASFEARGAPVSDLAEQIVIVDGRRGYRLGVGCLAHRPRGR